MMVEMMEDVHCSSGDQLESVDNLLFCSVNSEPSIKRRSVVKCGSTLRFIAVQILYCYLNSLNCIYTYYVLVGRLLF